MKLLSIPVNCSTSILAVTMAAMLTACSVLTTDLTYPKHTESYRQHTFIQQQMASQQVVEQYLPPRS